MPARAGRGCPGPPVARRATRGRKLVGGQGEGCGRGPRRGPHDRHPVPRQGQISEHSVLAEPLEGGGVVGLGGSGVRDHAELAVARARAVIRAGPLQPQDRAPSAPTTSSARIVSPPSSTSGGCVASTSMRSQRARSDAADALDPREPFPQRAASRPLSRMKASVATPAVVGGELEARVGRVAEDRHAADRLDAARVEQGPDLELAEELARGRADRVDAAVPVVARRLRRGRLDEHDVEAGTPERGGEARADESGADDRDVAVHAAILGRYRLSRTAARGCRRVSSCMVPAEQLHQRVDRVDVRRGRAGHAAQLDHRAHQRVDLGSRPPRRPAASRSCACRPSPRRRCASRASRGT